MADEYALRAEFNKKWPDLATVAASGPAGAEVLAKRMPKETGFTKTRIAGYLGDATGSAGIEELRHALTATGPHSQDLKCAAVVALTKRLREQATPDMIEALHDRNGVVRSYAITCLAHAGDDRGFDAVLTEVCRNIKRKTASNSTFPFWVAIAYLVRVGSPEQLERLATTMAPVWSKVHGGLRESVERFWPPVEVDGAVTYPADRASADKAAKALSDARSVLDMRAP